MLYQKGKEESEPMKYSRLIAVPSPFIAMLGLLGALATSPLHAACREAQIPGVPNPEIASEYEMLQAQRAVKNYIQLQEDFLDCTNNRSRQDRAIDNMHNVAEQYNRSARRFKARMQAADMFTELAYISLNR